MNKYKLYLHGLMFTTLCLFFLVINGSNAQPLNAKFYTNTLDAVVGDKIYLKLMVNPRPEKPIYTVSASLMYDPSVLEFVASEFTDSVKLLPVPKPPYTLTDTTNGMIRRTAGFTNGVDSLVNFTTYEFKAIKEGNTKISIEDGVVLDENNNDIGLQQKELTIRVGAPSDGATSTAEYSLNLNLDILGPIAVYKEKAYTFPIDIIGREFWIDKTIKVYVYNEKAELFFTEEKLLNDILDNPTTFTIPANTLVEGNYVISAETTDEFGQNQIIAQKSIGALSNGENWVTKNREFLLPFFLFIVAISIIHHVAKDRDLYFKIHSRLVTKRKKK